MNETGTGILVSDHQHTAEARHDFERLATMISSGQVEGKILEPEPSEADESQGRDATLMRRGIIMGGTAGFLIGLVPLLTSTLMGAATGALVAKAAQVRVDRELMARLRSARAYVSERSRNP